MGFFKSIVRTVTRALPTPVARIVAPVTKIATAVTQLNPSTLVKFAAQGPVLGPINFGAQTLAPKIAPYVELASTVALAAVPGGQTKMAINLGSILKSVGQSFGSFGNPYAQGISGIANLASQFIPQQINQTYVPQAIAMRAPQAIGPVLRSVPTVARGFFNKYPSLATSMQMLRNQGRNLKRSQLYSMMKRFGPEVLITGGILTAAAVSELMQAGPGHRRMNVGNVRALRRSMRRLESFHHLCQRADKLRKPRARSKKC